MMNKKLKETKYNDYTNEVINFIRTVDKGVKLSHSMIAKGCGLTFHIVKQLDIQNMIDEHNTTFYKIHQKVVDERRRIRNGKYRNKNKNKQKEYHKQWKKIQSQERREKRREELYKRIDVMSMVWVEYDSKYIVSDTGIVINKENFIEVSICVIKSGYCLIRINGKSMYHHRLVAKLFIPNPDNKAEVNHKNGIRDDNRVENLEWVTHKENIQHSFNVLGRVSNFTGWGDRIPNAVKPKLIKMIKAGFNYDDTNEVLGISQSYYYTTKKQLKTK